MLAYAIGPETVRGPLIMPSMVAQCVARLNGGAAVAGMVAQASLPAASLALRRSTDNVRAAGLLAMRAHAVQDRPEFLLDVAGFALQERNHAGPARRLEPLRDRGQMQGSLNLVPHITEQTHFKK